MYEDAFAIESGRGQSSTSVPWLLTSSAIVPSVTKTRKARLKILSIQSNRIRKLEGLRTLESLEEFYISRDGVQRLEGLSNWSKRLPRKVVESPLAVRHPSSDIYTPAGRKRLLDYIGVPERLQSTDTKILIVSFGGQLFRLQKIQVQVFQFVYYPAEDGAYGCLIALFNFHRANSN